MNSKLLYMMISSARLDDFGAYSTMAKKSKHLKIKVNQNIFYW
jgi:hypothetical protein